MEFLKRLKRDRRGASAIEYGLIAALIAIVIVTTATDVGNRLNGVFQRIVNALPN